MENITYTSRSYDQKLSSLFALSANSRFSNNPKILLVEDNFLARQAEQLILESLGCEVTAAQDGEEGLRFFHSGLQAVVLDIDLPGISGMTLAKKIRRIEPHMPIIACTSNCKCSQEDYLNAGIDLVLEKPMRIENTYVSLVPYMRQRVQ